MDESERSYLVGLLGSGIGSSLTPALHMREAREQHLTYVYRLLDTGEDLLADGELRDVVAAARFMGFNGLNVTFPYKQRVIAHLDHLDETADRLGAVNTVLFAEGRAIGHNTDVVGFRLAFERHLGDVVAESVVQLGAGGAGAAVADALLSLGVRRLTIVDQDVERADQLVARLRGRLTAVEVAAAGPAAVRNALEDADGLVHCTPTGMAHHPGLPLDPTCVEPRHWVADIVYRPLRTELLDLASAAGCRVLHGGFMAVYQAVRTFEMITGRRADPARMLKHLEELVATEPPDSRLT